MTGPDEVAGATGGAGAARSRHWGLALVLAATLAAARLAMAAALELSPDEAYYWTWSLEPALAYADHPPMTAWLVLAGTSLLGPTEIGVRLWFVVLGGALGPLGYAVVRAAGGGPPAALLVSAAIGTSLLGSAASLLATPETPLAFGWTVALLGLVRAAAGAPRTSAWAAVAFGTAVALLSKLTGVLLPAVAIGWLLVSPGARNLRRSPWPWGALGIGIATALPAAIADLRAAGGSIAFQLAHGLWAPGIGFAERLANVAAYFGGQLGLLSPLVAVGVVAFFHRRPPADDAPVSLLWLAAVVPWSAFGAASLLAPPEANWPAVAHVAGLVGAGLAVERAARRGARWASAPWIAAALAMQAIPAALVHAHVLRPFLPFPGAPQSAFEGPREPTARLRGWRDLAAAIERQGEPVMAGWYGIEAEMRFYGGPGAPPVLWEDDDAAFVGWWIGPSSGAVLPGGAEHAPPGWCRAAPPGGRVDPGLMRPAAPVRLVRIWCKPAAPQLPAGSG